MGVFVTGRQVVLEIPMPGWWLSGASVDLDFDSGRYYDSSTPNPRAATDFLSCTRASTGYAKTSTGTLTSFASNVLRITDLGLLVEDARTNALIRSQEFDNSWTPTNATVTADTTTAPDGTSTADTITSTGTAAFILQNYASPAVAPATVSVYAKNSSGTGWFALSNAGVITFYDLVNGIVGSQALGTDGTYGIEAMGNGWYRCWWNQQVTGNLGALRIRIANADGDFTANTSGQTRFIWGAQMEAASFMSSYIPSTSTSATRAADSIAITGNAQTTIAAATGSIVAQIGTQASTSFAANIVDSNGTNVLGYNASNNALASLVATLASGNTGNRNAGDDKLGLAWSGAGRSIVLNGGTVATDASAQTPSSTQKLGSANATSNFIYAYIERLTLFNSKIADATLQGFTR